MKANDYQRLAIAPSFLHVECKPPVMPTTPSPKTALPATMAKVLEASARVYKDTKTDGENKYTRKIRKVIEGIA